MCQEIWRPVIGYEDRYEISNLGRVKAIPRDVVCQFCGSDTTKATKILNFAAHTSGYMRVGLRNGKDQKWHRVHRLVAEAFIPNPDNKPFVNHKNLNRLDNRVENLEWVTPKENSQHYHSLKQDRL